MNAQLNELLDKYRISQSEIADVAGVSRPLVSLVLKGERKDRRGIVSTALDLIEAAKNEELKNQMRLAELCSPAA